MFRCNQVGTHHILDIDQITRLSTVAKDRHRLAIQQTPRKDGNCGGIH
jgi:hypothetical protein